MPLANEEQHTLLIYICEILNYNIFANWHLGHKVSPLWLGCNRTTALSKAVSNGYNLVSLYRKHSLCLLLKTGLFFSFHSGSYAKSLKKLLWKAVAVKMFKLLAKSKCVFQPIKVVYTFWGKSHQRWVTPNTKFKHCRIC